MKNPIVITAIFWVLWFVGINLYVEYIISRPMNSFIQLGTSISALILTVGLIIKTVKLFNNFNINKKK